MATSVVTHFGGSSQNDLVTPMVVTKKQKAKISREMSFKCPVTFQNQPDREFVHFHINSNHHLHLPQPSTSNQQPALSELEPENVSSPTSS